MYVLNEFLKKKQKRNISLVLVILDRKVPNRTSLAATFWTCHVSPTTPAPGLNVIKVPEDFNIKCFSVHYLTNLKSFITIDV